MLYDVVNQVPSYPMPPLHPPCLRSTDLTSHEDDMSVPFLADTPKSGMNNWRTPLQTMDSIGKLSLFYFITIPPG